MTGVGMKRSGAGKSLISATTSVVMILIKNVSNDNQLIAWSKEAKRQRGAVALKAQHMKEELGGGGRRRG